jgi:nitroimidazol reductase NimA-like FMN-containing flavoprotein (pyridoxamine 5'-phosphate oxidase superfamily)
MTREFIDSKLDMEQILKEQLWGNLGLIDGDQPYVVPLNYGYVDGKILFHCGLEGRKLDCLRANPRVCFTVARQSGAVTPHPGGNPCHVDNDSVICFGTARIVQGDEDRKRLLNAFNQVFRPGAKLPMNEIPACHVVEITITEMTGRREKDYKVTNWRHVAT